LDEQKNKHTSRIGGEGELLDFTLTDVSCKKLMYRVKRGKPPRYEDE
jgi:hypothetical protein